MRGEMVLRRKLNYGNHQVRIAASVVRNVAIKFVDLVRRGEKKIQMCVFFEPELTEGGGVTDSVVETKIQSVDVFGETFHFVLDSLPGEVSARKIVMPCRPNLVEKWKIKAGDIVTGRPMSAGCPVQHVLQVIKANPITGILDTWCVGPQFSRGKKIYDVEAYVMLGFEGIAKVVGISGIRQAQRFLPGFCMMNATHTGVVNMVLKNHTDYT